MQSMLSTENTFNQSIGDFFHRKKNKLALKALHDKESQIVQLQVRQVLKTVCSGEGKIVIV